jgi:hypothetical protein
VLGVVRRENADGDLCSTVILHDFRKKAIMKHTPGPWKWHPMTTGSGSKILAIHSPMQRNSGGVFEVCREYIDDEPRDAVERIEADFSLIAAAPELLAALGNALINEGQDACCLPLVNPCHCWRCQARRAIAKAKGES